MVNNFVEDTISVSNNIRVVLEMLSMDLTEDSIIIYCSFVLHTSVFY